MQVERAASDDEVLACFEAMSHLRGLENPDSFLRAIRAQERSGYQLAFVVDLGRVPAVVGFRFGDSLAWGHYLYVDDLVVLPNARSNGYGAALVAWVHERAAERSASAIHLDTAAIA